MKSTRGVYTVIIYIDVNVMYYWVIIHLVKSLQAFLSPLKLYSNVKCKFLYTHDIILYISGLYIIVINRRNYWWINKEDNVCYMYINDRAYFIYDIFSIYTQT